MKSNKQKGNRDDNNLGDQGEARDQDNEAGSHGFLGGLTDAVSGVFDTADRAAHPRQGGIMGGITDSVSDIFNSAEKVTRPAQGGMAGGINDAVSGIFDTAEQATNSASEASADSGDWLDPSYGGYGGTAYGENASQGSLETGSGTGDPGTGADASITGGGEEEPFVGSGGVGSPEFYEMLRKAHEQAGGEYTSDLGDPNRPG